MVIRYSTLLSVLIIDVLEDRSSNHVSDLAVNDDGRQSTAFLSSRDRLSAPHVRVTQRGVLSPSRHWATIIECDYQTVIANRSCDGHTSRVVDRRWRHYREWTAHAFTRASSLISTMRSVSDGIIIYVEALMWGQPCRRVVVIIQWRPGYEMPARVIAVCCNCRPPTARQ